RRPDAGARRPGEAILRAAAARGRGVARKAPCAGGVVARPRRGPGPRMTPGLPPIVRIFARFVPADLREPIAGDLAEEYAELRRHRGTLAATVWLWGQAVRLAWAFRWERATRGRGLPP